MNQRTISTIHLNTDAFLQDGVAGDRPQARIDVRPARCDRQDQEKALHSVNPSGLGLGRIDALGTSDLRHSRLWS